MTPSISIAMATYDGARFVAEQLASFAAQTRLPDELVVTDDGSTDGTLEIVERFAATAPFAVHIHRNPARLGYTLNFSEAVSKCEGEIIFLPWSGLRSLISWVRAGQRGVGNAAVIEGF